MRCRILLQLMLATTILFASTSPALAVRKSESSEQDRRRDKELTLPDGALVDDPSLTPEVLEDLRNRTREKEERQGIGNAWGTGKKSLNSYGLQTRSVSNFQQETAYWCGPASIRQSLNFHKTRSGSSTGLPSQTTLANKAGTGESGSSTTSLARALNGYSGTFGSINYVASNLEDQSSPYESFVNRVGTQLRSITVNPTIPVILTATQFIPRYSGHVSRHYMCVSGIDDRNSPMLMRSVDPNCNNSYFGVQWDNVGSTTSKGLFRACWEADKAGSNMAMAW